MMYDFGVCSQCQMEISEERLQASPVVCDHCGFTADKSQSLVARKLEKKKTNTMIGISAALLISFVALVIWDSHVLTAVPLQAKKIMGMASADDYETLYEICKDRADLECQIDNLKHLGKFKNDAMARLGKTQLLMKDYKAAEATLSQYFNDGGISLDASYDYARALEALGNIEMAGKYYQSILDEKPETLQITVTRRYIQMLLDYNRRGEAKKVLASIRKKGDNTATFMEQVFTEL